MYADVETGCVSFHECGVSGSGVMEIENSFVCPEGYLFNQDYFLCDLWWYVDCPRAEERRH